MIVQGASLAGGVRAWSGGTPPQQLGGVQAILNGGGTGIGYISPTELYVQLPGDAATDGWIYVDTDSGSSNAFPLHVAAASPGLYTYQSGTSTYPVARFRGTSITVGDPAVNRRGVRKARTGDVIQLYATGLGPSPGGALLNAPIPFIGTVTVTLDWQNATVLGTALVSPGLFQITFQVPALVAGDYILTLSAGGQPSQAGVTFPITQ